MQTHTEYFKYSKLANADGASTVVRVAMVCNDLMIANSLLGHYTKIDSNALNMCDKGDDSTS